MEELNTNYRQNEISHYGVKGMHWGIRRSKKQNIKAQSKKHLGIDDNGNINIIWRINERCRKCDCKLGFFSREGCRYFDCRGTGKGRSHNYKCVSGRGSKRTVSEAYCEKREIMKQSKKLT